MVADVEARSPAGRVKDVLEDTVVQSTTQAAGKKHNPNHLWYIHGKAYDLTEFMKVHPGGPTAILNTIGTDATALFESYHPFTERPHQLLAKMKEVKLAPEVLATKCVDTSKGNFFFLPDGTRDPFWEALRERCGKVMKEQNISRTMSWGHFIFHVFLLTIQPVLWWFGYCAAFPWTSHGTAVVMAVTTWIAGRLGHDGGHFAVSRKYAINRFVGNWAGLGLSNMSYWELLHTSEHHSMTNTEADPDLYHYVYFLRDHPNYPWSFFHRFQVHRIYCYGVWSFTTAGLLMIEPLVMLLTGSGTVPPTFKLQKFRFFWWFKLVGHMLGFPLVMFGIPLYLNWDTTTSPKWAEALVRFASFFIYCSITGLLFGLFSQVNHFSEDCVAAASRNTSWAVRQVETAANFCVDSLFWSIITAGIHVQIEHHLFPALSSDKVVHLIPVVRDTCKEFGVTYKDFNTFGGILNSVHAYIDTLAKPNPGKPAPASPSALK